MMNPDQVPLPQIKPYQTWFKNWQNLEKLVIAGPCSAESYEQLELCIQKMQANENWHVLRTGIWKPRSRPGGFDGNEEALEWVAALKKQYNFLHAVEVATPEQVEKALKAKVDILWIGARTVVLPFAIEELAKSLAGSKIPILIKNPISPDLSLWRGAVERFLLQDIQNLAIVHRGFSLPYREGLRNWPLWSMVAMMRLHFPQISVLSDPSHMAGSAHLVGKMAQEAINFGCDGLMIETHPDPVSALSDAKQQIKLDDFSALIGSLEWPLTAPDDSKLSYLRMQIDEVDQQLIELLKKRDELCGYVAETKMENNIQVVDVERYALMLQKRKSWFSNKAEDQIFIDQLYNLIHERSISQQLNIFSTSRFQ